MTRPNNRHAAQASLSPSRAAPAETARFDALAGRWWDKAGPMRALHAMNPARIGWITARAAPGALLDVGCGGGLAAEPLGRAGHTVLGIDAAPAVIAAAQAHAATLPEEQRPSYRVATASELAAEPARWPTITALDVIEHVPDPAGLVAALAGLLAPGGRLFVTTLNRTARSLLVAKVGAEYVARLLPAGTHDWRQFITPAELARHARAAGLRAVDSAGLSFDPLRGRWYASRDLGINYVACFAAPHGRS